MKIRKSELARIIQEEAASISKQRTLTEYRGKNRNPGVPDGTSPANKPILAQAHVLFAYNKPVGAVGGVINAALHNGQAQFAFDQLQSHASDAGGVFSDTDDRESAQGAYSEIMGNLSNWHTAADTGVSKNMAWGFASSHRDGTHKGVIKFLMEMTQWGHMPDSHMNQDPDSLVLALAEMGRNLG